MAQTVFERFEKKYLLSPLQYEQFNKKIKSHLQPDVYGPSTVCNLYADTPNWLLIRRSIEKPVYKEKLRLRSYGVPNESTSCFLELKKKSGGVVYKRRITLPYSEALAVMNGQLPLKNAQIEREISWFIQSLDGLKAAAAICYDREAFTDKEEPGLRYTFDRNLTARSEELDLRSGTHGVPLLETGQVLLELKAPQSLPIWLVQCLGELKIFPTGFSKYGTFYKKYILPTIIQNGGF